MYYAFDFIWAYHLNPFLKCCFFVLELSELSRGCTGVGEGDQACHFLASGVAFPTDLFLPVANGLSQFLYLWLGYLISVLLESLKVLDDAVYNFAKLLHKRFDFLCTLINVLLVFIAVFVKSFPGNILMLEFWSILVWALSLSNCKCAPFEAFSTVSDQVTHNIY